MHRFEDPAESALLTEQKAIISQIALPEQNAVKLLTSIRDMLEALGYDLDDPHMRKTPLRVAKMYAETLGGNFTDEKAFSARMTTFEDSSYDGLVMVRGVSFYSFCAHHMAMFHGTFSLGYLPTKGKVLGLSKLVRIFRHECRFFTTQEKITSGAAHLLSEITGSPDVMCRVVAEHTCMSCRGVQSHGAETVTATPLGKFLTNQALREEFMANALQKA